MVVIYLRHGEDEQSSYKYDQKLTETGKKQAIRLAKKLIKKHGLPDIIYYSPYVRTRQTLKYMMKAINKYRKQNYNNINNGNNGDKKPVLKVEPRLGRFFTKTERKNPDIRDSTLEKGAIIKESKQDFRNRIKSQLEEVLCSQEKEESRAVIWNITHTLVLLRVAEFTEKELPEHLSFLQTVTI